jgi:membrane-bound metal-dependent hydrolase YbcI (DUF457 family)
MANFKTHVSIATAASSCAAVVTLKAQLVNLIDLPLLIFLGVVGGMLPDIDANNSKPVNLLFTVLALLGAAMGFSYFHAQHPAYPSLLFAAACYAVIRYAVLAVFNSLTQHRGVFHSLLAAVFFTLLMTCTSYYFWHWNVLHAWLNGLFVAFGFLVHLLLDECYSVDLSNKRLKKSFGTALKLFSYKNKNASLLMLLCTWLLWRVTPAPTALLNAVKHITLQQLLSLDFLNIIF